MGLPMARGLDMLGHDSMANDLLADDPGTGGAAAGRAGGGRQVVAAVGRLAGWACGGWPWVAGGTAHPGVD